MTKFALLATATFALAACGGGDDATAGGDLPVSEERVAPVAAPEGGEWSEMVEKTSEGGYRMGNPDAPIKVVEFGSMTCSACAYFDANGYEPLVEYVNSGRVNFEYRNFVANAVDITASVLARCGSTERFFPLTHAMFAAQPQWLNERGPQIQRALSANPNAGVEAQLGAIAEASGLKTFVAQRGLPSSEADRCLADRQGAEELQNMRSQADADFDITGTPTFYVNGAKLDGSQWDSLEPALQRALGEPVTEPAQPADAE